MDFALTPDQEALRDGVRKLCDGRVTMDRVRAAAGLPGGVDLGVWRELAETGVFSLTVDEADGGAGLGSPEAALVFEQLGRSLAPGPLVWTQLAAGVVDGAAAGRTVVAGVDGRHVAQAERMGKPVLVEHLDAAGALVMLSDDAVHALDPSGIHGEPAPSTDPLTPVSRVDPAALRASAGDRMPASAPALRRTATVLTSSLLLGIAGATTDAAVSYAKEREQFDRPIGSFQAIKHILADMFLRTEVARAAVYSAAVTNDDATVGDADVAAAVAKLLAADAAIANAKANVQVHGGMGFTWDVDAHLYLKRAWVLQHAFGTTEEHADAVAWSLVGAPYARRVDVIP